jgi:hypothetical protein
LVHSDIPGAITPGDPCHVLFQAVQQYSLAQAQSLSIKNSIREVISGTAGKVTIVIFSNSWYLQWPDRFRMDR